MNQEIILSVKDLSVEYKAVSYTHLDVYKRQVNRSVVGSSPTGGAFLFYQTNIKESLWKD